MRVPLSWLQEYLSLEQSPEQIAELLTLSGLEVDGIEAAPLSFSGVVVGEVRSVVPHPQSDHLRIAEVFDGDTCVSVVCGDPQCSPGMHTAFAKLGAKLTDETGQKLCIKKTKLRGVFSYGMLCSEKELGLSDRGETIMRIDSSLTAGTPLEKIYGDHIFVVSLTPNLGHCMSILGIARELKAQLALPLKTRPSLELLEEMPPSEEAIEIAHLDPKCALNYHCRFLRNCKIAPSPDWLQRRLQCAGMHCVNNVVDVTNYVMLELGQPLHAFDWDTFAKKTVTIRQAPDPFSLELLDGKTYPVPKGTATIYAGDVPVSIAGVMGGAATQVQQTSQNILLEAASFVPEAVRKSSKLIGLRTEASARFERGTDPHQPKEALERAATLLAQLTGATVARGTVSKIAVTPKKKSLCCRLAKTNQILGTDLGAHDVENILQRLDMQPKRLDRDSFQVTIPSYRNDVHAEIDLIEDIARLFGYHRIPRGSAKAPLTTLPHSPLFLMEQKVRAQLLSEGLQEFLTCNLVHPAAEERFAENALSKKRAISVLRPSSVDQSVLRSSLLPSLLHSVKLNFQTKQSSLAIFEIGRIHFRGDAYCERPMAAILLTGKARPHHWEEKPRSVDFFDLKGIIENLLKSLEIPNPTFSQKTLASFHPKRQAEIAVGPLTVGSLGELSPQKLLEMDIDVPIFFAQLDLFDLLEAATPKQQMTPLPLYPESKRDWTVALPPTVSAGELVTALLKMRSKWLKDVVVWDFYENTHLTLRLTYRNDKATMTHEQVEKEHLRLIDTVTKQKIQKDSL